MTRTLCVVVAVLDLTSIVALGQSTPDPKILMGTWKLNVEKSQFIPGPGPKSQTLTWTPTATGFSFTVDTVTPQGQTTQAQQHETFDGKPYPVKVANVSVMRTTKWIDAFTFEVVDTVNGEVRTSRTGVISQDGKILTMRSKGLSAEGQVAVYEKQ